MCPARIAAAGVCPACASSLSAAGVCAPHVPATLSAAGVCAPHVPARVGSGVAVAPHVPARIGCGRLCPACALPNRLLGQDESDVRVASNGFFTLSGCLGFLAVLCIIAFYITDVEDRKAGLSTVPGVERMKSRAWQLTRSVSKSLRMRRNAGSSAAEALMGAGTLLLLSLPVTQIIMGALKAEARCDEELALWNIVFGFACFGSILAVYATLMKLVEADWLFDATLPPAAEFALPVIGILLCVFLVELYGLGGIWTLRSDDCDFELLVLSRLAGIAWMVAAVCGCGAALIAGFCLPSARQPSAFHGGEAASPAHRQTRSGHTEDAVDRDDYPNQASPMILSTDDDVVTREQGDSVQSEGELAAQPGPLASSPLPPPDKIPSTAAGSAHPLLKTISNGDIAASGTEVKTTLMPSPAVEITQDTPKIGHDMPVVDSNAPGGSEGGADVN
ncbi:hypothetical protein CYMTET_54752 [Cymbomonas tetramitiformis]|uniref:Uncharacterized protein n=1 Tax=Cymbomonas tetramitiformis TaxID=36881 RepID=A0AAE0BE96_9CHLO|nr:hypothetical protein CYMTET_54752 [Cymbomonas tetramitiformis]